MRRSFSQEKMIKDKKNFNQIYNVGTGKKTTVNKLIKLISKLYKKENKRFELSVLMI